MIISQGHDKAGIITQIQYARRIILDKVVTFPTSQTYIDGKFRTRRIKKSKVCTQVFTLNYCDSLKVNLALWTTALPSLK